MSEMGKVVSVVDAVCNCLPVVSTIACSAQLLYLACRVNNIANPVRPVRGVATEIKLHVVNKTMFELVIGLIPVVGNLYHITKLIISGFKDQLRTAICSNNLEAVRLCIANNYFEDVTVPRKYHPLLLAANRSNRDVFDLILKGHGWTMQELITGLEIVSVADNESEGKASDILNRYIRKFSDSTVSKECILPLITVIGNFLKSGKTELLNQLISMLPKCSWNELQELIKDYSFDYNQYSVDAKKPALLSRENLDALLDRCQHLSLRDVLAYCSVISYRKSHLEAHLTALNAQEVLRTSGEIQSHIVSSLIEKVDTDNKPQDVVYRLALLPNRDFLDLFLKKYESTLSSSDKLKILKNMRLHPSDTEEQQLKKKELFRFLLQRFSEEFSIEEVRSLYENMLSIESPSALNNEIYINPYDEPLTLERDEDDEPLPPNVSPMIKRVRSTATARISSALSPSDEHLSITIPNLNEDHLLDAQRLSMSRAFSDNQRSPTFTHEDNEALLRAISRREIRVRSKFSAMRSDSLSPTDKCYSNEGQDEDVLVTPSRLSMPRPMFGNQGFPAPIDEDEDALYPVGSSRGVRVRSTLAARRSDSLSPPAYRAHILRDSLSEDEDETSSPLESRRDRGVFSMNLAADLSPTTMSRVNDDDGRFLTPRAGLQARDGLSSIILEMFPDLNQAEQDEDL